MRCMAFCVLLKLMLCSTGGITAATTSIALDGAGHKINGDNRTWALFDAPTIADGNAPKITVTDEGNGWQRVQMRWILDQEVAQDELAVSFDLEFDRISGGRRT